MLCLSILFAHLTCQKKPDPRNGDYYPGLQK